MNLFARGKTWGMAALVACLMIWSGAPALAQVTTGTVTGTVKDAPGRRRARRDGDADQRDARHEPRDADQPERGLRRSRT